MSDDAPLEPINPEAQPPTEPATTPTAAAAPTEPVPVTGTDATPPTWPASPTQPTQQPQAAPAQPAPPSSSSTIAVPKWLALVLGALVIALIGFGIGYAVAPGDDDGGQAAIRPGSEFVPPFNNNGGGSGDLPTIPSPSPQTGRERVPRCRDDRLDESRRCAHHAVVDDSPAADAGLKVDDVITKVDDDAVTSPTELAEKIGDEDPGDEVTITYVRDGDTKTADVTLKLRNSFQIPTPSTTRPQS